MVWVPNWSITFLHYGIRVHHCGLHLLLLFKSDNLLISEFPCFPKLLFSIMYSELIFVRSLNTSNNGKKSKSSCYLVKQVILLKISCLTDKNNNDIICILSLSWLSPTNVLHPLLSEVNEFSLHCEQMKGQCSVYTICLCFVGEPVAGQCFSAD